MDLKLRFSLFFSAVMLLILGVFSIGIYYQIREGLLLSAETQLIEFVDHEWNHIELEGSKTAHLDESIRADSLSARVERKGVLLRTGLSDRLEKLMEGPERARRSQVLWKKVTGKVRGEEYSVLGVYDLTGIQNHLSALKQAAAIWTLLATLLVIPLSWFFSGFLLRPFRWLARETSNLKADALDVRFPEPKQLDEYGALVRSVNRLLARLERSFDQMKRFAVYASHELRTPLTVIRGECEITRRKTRDREEYESSLDRICVQATSMQTIIESLLFLSDLERHNNAAERELVRVADIVQRAVESLSVKHCARPVEVRTEVPWRVTVPAFPVLFSSIVTNLLDNALKNANSGVKIRAFRQNLDLNLEIHDDGPGLAPTSRESAPPEEGHGLGLYIVRSAVEAHGGRFEMTSSSLGGLCARVTMPLVEGNA